MEVAVNNVVAQHGYVGYENTVLTKGIHAAKMEIGTYEQFECKALVAEHANKSQARAAVVSHHTIDDCLKQTVPLAERYGCKGISVYPAYDLELNEVLTKLPDGLENLDLAKEAVTQALNNVEICGTMFEIYLIKDNALQSPKANERFVGGGPLVSEATMKSVALRGTLKHGKTRIYDQEPSFLLKSSTYAYSRFITQTTKNTGNHIRNMISISELPYCDIFAELFSDTVKLSKRLEKAESRLQCIKDCTHLTRKLECAAAAADMLFNTTDNKLALMGVANNVQLLTLAIEAVTSISDLLTALQWTVDECAAHIISHKNDVNNFEENPLLEDWKEGGSISIKVGNALTLSKKGASWPQDCYCVEPSIGNIDTRDMYNALAELLEQGETEENSPTLNSIERDYKNMKKPANFKKLYMILFNNSIAVWQRQVAACPILHLSDVIQRWHTLPSNEDIKEFGDGLLQLLDGILQSGPTKVRATDISSALAAVTVALQDESIDTRGSYDSSIISKHISDLLKNYPHDKALTIGRGNRDPHGECRRIMSQTMLVRKGESWHIGRKKKWHKIKRVLRWLWFKGRITSLTVMGSGLTWEYCEVPHDKDQFDLIDIAAYADIYKSGAAIEAKHIHELFSKCANGKYTEDAYKVVRSVFEQFLARNTQINVEIRGDRACWTHIYRNDEGIPTELPGSQLDYWNTSAPVLKYISNDWHYADVSQWPYIRSNDIGEKPIEQGAVLTLAITARHSKWLWIYNTTPKDATNYPSDTWHIVSAPQLQDKCNQYIRTGNNTLSGERMLG